MDESSKTGYSVGSGTLFTVKKVAKYSIRPQKIHFLLKRNYMHVRQKHPPVEQTICLSVLTLL